MGSEWVLEFSWHRLLLLETMFRWAGMFPGLEGTPGRLAALQQLPPGGDSALSPAAPIISSRLLAGNAPSSFSFL